MTQEGSQDLSCTPTNSINILADRRKHITTHHTGDTVEHVHVTDNTVARFELTPGHDPRTETETYRQSHHELINKLDSPCLVCGVRKSTLTDPAVNRYGAKGMETHHYPIERSLLNACDPAKIHETFPQVTDLESLAAFVDTQANLIVLCDIHHRSTEQGIHHLLSQDFAILPYLYDGYQIAASSKDCTTIVENNEKIQKEHHAKKANASSK